METEVAWRVTADEVKARGYNLDIKNPHTVADDHGDPEELLAKLDAAEEDVAAPGSAEGSAVRGLGTVTPHRFVRLFDDVANAPDAVPKLRNLLLELAVSGRLLELGGARRQKTLHDVLADLQTGPFGSSLHESDYQVGGTPVVNPASIVRGRIVPLPKMAVDRATLDRLASFRLCAGGIVMARRGEMGRCAVVTDLEAGWLCGTGSLILRLTKDALPEYVALAIGAPSSRRHLAATAVGITMQNLNQTVLRRLPVRVPSLAEQRRIVAKVDELHVEINDQTNAPASEFQIAEKLRVVHRKQGVDGLNFDQDAFSNQQVCSITAFELHSLILKRDRFLPLKGNIPKI